MIINAKVCANCAGKMTNPTCRICRGREITAWLNDLKINQESKENIIKKVKEIYNTITPMDITCLQCSKKTTPICTKCFFLNAQQILVKNNISEENIKQFNTSFDYTLF